MSLEFASILYHMRIIPALSFNECRKMLLPQLDGGFHGIDHIILLALDK